MHDSNHFLKRKMDQIKVIQINPRKE